MNACDVTFPGFDAAALRGPIRFELFLHRAVCEVERTERTDTLRIIHTGAPQLDSWRLTLVRAGFPAPTFELCDPLDAAA